MKITTILVAALSLAFLSACDRGEPRPKMDANPSASGSSAAPTTPPSSANSGAVERNPVQGQVDPKQNPQRKDFQTGGK